MLVLFLKVQSSLGTFSLAYTNIMRKLGKRYRIRIGLGLWAKTRTRLGLGIRQGLRLGVRQGLGLGS